MEMVSNGKILSSNDPQSGFPVYQAVAAWSKGFDGTEREYYPSTMSLMAWSFHQKDLKFRAQLITDIRVIIGISVAAKVLTYLQKTFFYWIEYTSLRQLFQLVAVDSCGRKDICLKILRY